MYVCCMLYIFMYFVENFLRASKRHLISTYMIFMSISDQVIMYIKLCWNILIIANVLVACYYVCV